MRLSSDKRSSRLRRAVRYVLPSLAAALVAGLVAGAIESALHNRTALSVIAAIGFAALYAMPVGVVGALVVRGLWTAWRPRQLAASLVEDGGGAPRLAAWLVFVGLAIIVTATASFNAIRILLSKTAVPDVVALATALIGTVVLGALAVVSRPAVNGLARVFRALDRRIQARWDRSVLRPAYLLIAGVVAVAVGCYISWVVSIRPRIGHLDLGFLLYPALFVALCAAIHATWRALPRRAVLAGAGGVTVLCLAVTFYVRYERPFVMLDVWGSTPTAGAVIDSAYDLEQLRRELPLAEIALERRPGASSPDIVLITIDTMRADFAPPYGGKARMPALRRLASTGAVFEWAFSPGNVTRRSLPTIATGVSSTRMSGRVVGWALRLDPRHIVLAEFLRAAGYQTAGFFCCESHFGPQNHLGLSRGIEHFEFDRHGGKLSGQAAAWLAERRRRGDARPAFLWLHYIELHVKPKVPPRKNEGPKNKVERAKWLYRRKLAEIDGYLATVFSAARTTPNPAGTVIAITSDHGEGLMDHGHKYHSTTLYNAQIRVPLILVGPGIKPGKIGLPVGLVDVTPTLLDVAGLTPPGMPMMDGVSRAPLMRGDETPDPDGGEVFAAMIKDRSVDIEMRAVIVGRYKLIQRSDRKRDELYDIRADPNERQNLITRKPELAESLRQRLAARRERDAISPF